MKTYLTILGCGSSMGIPRADGFWGLCNKKNKKNYRTRCSAFISRGKNNILIDTSPDLRLQLLANNIKNINSVLYTHFHADQTNGINDLRVFFIKNKKKLNIFADKITLSYLKKNYSYCFKKKYPYPPILKDNILKKNFFLGSGNNRISFKSFKVKHGNVYSSAFIFNNSAYISDCSHLTKLDLKKLMNLRYLIIDCFRYKPHPSHLCFKDVLAILKEIKPNKTILTNLHSDLDYNILLQKVPINVKPAFDGLRLEL